MECGAEWVAERGKIWRLRRMGLESSGAFSGGLLPTENIFTLEARWAERAAPCVASFLSDLISTVKQAGETVIEAGAVGPPWDGTAAVEGFASPVTTATTNLVLRGLILDADYHVAIAALDTTGNESPPVVAGPVRTQEGPPLPPSNILLRFESDGSAHVAWTVSEDDGFNDRDVVRYEVWRAVLPGGEFSKVVIE